LFEQWHLGRSPNTVEARTRDLTAFGVWLHLDPSEPEQVARHLLSLGPLEAAKVVTRWDMAMDKAEHPPTTRARRISTLRSLVEKACELATLRGLGSWRLFVKPPKFNKFELTEGPPAAEVEKVIEALNAGTGTSAARLPLRNRALVLLCFDAGLRITEACTLKLEAVDYRKPAVTVKRKGNNLVKRTITDRCKVAIRMYVGRRAAGFMFPGRKEGTHLSRRTAWDVFHQLGLMHPHAMRHSGATEIWERSKDLQLVQEHLGHRDITTTQVYMDRVGDKAGQASRILAGEE
jgi:site-specific recombinase XerD